MSLTESCIPASTIEAYLAAHYTVLADKPFVLKINRSSPELANLFELNQTYSAAFLTAWNPSSVLTPATKNHAAQQMLIAKTKSRDLQYLYGESTDPAGQWPGEPSLLIFGISLESAKELAKQFNQNAFVYAESDATPQLVLLR